MAEFKSIREIAAELVENYQRKARSGPFPPAAAEAARQRLIQAAMEMEVEMKTLNAKDRDWLERIGIRV